MKLLHWCTLQPKSSSGLAAIRFTAPVRVSKIRVFPNGARPFVQCPDIVAQTHPDSFFLDVFFNAMPINPAESKDKQRAPNALVPTTIAYAGGQVDFTVDLGTEYASRLMIVKGQFDAVSLAIYGDVVSEIQVSRTEPLAHKPIPVNEPLPLSRALDPANATDPTSLAKNLLSIIEDAPPLCLVSRLMFCLKPANEDWDESNFPYLYADLEQACTEELTLDAAVECLLRPVSDSVPEDALSKFVESISAALGTKDSNQSFLVAKIFRISAPQLPSFGLKLCHHIDPSSVFDVNSVDEDTLLELLDASANPDIARHLNTPSFLDTLREVQESANHDKSTQVAARRLSSRVSAWAAFEDALTNTRADFTESITMLKEIAAEEQSLGIWLMSMTQHDDILTKMSENPIFSSTHTYPRLLSSIRNVNSRSGAVSHDDFITFIRAFIGVTSVLAVWAWADSLAHDLSRERVLGVLHLWQGVDGYRETVNYLLLLPQLSKRLGWIISDKVEVPRKSTIFGEKILLELCKDPDAFLHYDLVDTILSIEPPLCFIQETERLTIRKIALVADDGLHAAIDELTFSSDHPLSLRRLRTLRVSIGVLDKELDGGDDKGEWKILQAIWDDHSVALIPRLVDVFVEVANDLNQHFVVTAPPPTKDQVLVDQLFRTAEDLLRLLSRLSTKFSLAARSLRILTLGIADVFACTDIADTIYSQNTSACASAQSMRQTCLDVVRKFSEPGFTVEPEKLGAEIILRTLFDHGIGDSHGRDPAYHLLQMFTLVDHVLPEPSQHHQNGLKDESWDQQEEREQLAHWVLSVLPNVLNEAQKFFRSLDVENRVHFMRRLVKLDKDGLVGLGEWLLIEELKYLVQFTQSLSVPTTNPDERAVLQYQVSSSLQFLYLLVKPSSNISEWCIQAISSTPDVSLNLTTCLKELVICRVVSSHLNDITEILASHSSSFNEELKNAIVLLTLMTLRQDPLKGLWPSVADLLKDLTIEEPNTLRAELGDALAATAHGQASASVDVSSATAIVSILEWLVAQPDTKYTILCGIKPDDLASLYGSLEGALSDPDSSRLKTLKPKFSVDEDESLTGASDIVVSDRLELTLAGIEDLLRPPALMQLPSTPKKGTPDLFGLVLSPPAALLRSTTATGLTKTYLNNDFRELRQTPSARQNTSRLPSMHVDVGISGQST